MPNEFKLEDVEAALLALFTEKMGAEGVQVAALATADFNEQGSLVVQGQQAVFLLFEREDLPPGRDQARRLYDSRQNWMALCAAQNLKGITEERNDAYKLVSRAKQVVAARRLALADGSTTAPMELIGVQLEQFEPEGTVYSLRFFVTDTAQFIPES